MRIRDWSSDVCASDLRTLVAFLFGTVGVVVGAWLGARLLDLGPFGAEYAAVFGATYVGGSINFAAAAEAVGFRDPTALAVGVDIQIGRASCRDSVCQSGVYRVSTVTIKKTDKRR